MLGWELQIHKPLENSDDLGRNSLPAVMFGKPPPSNVPQQGLRLPRPWNLQWEVRVLAAVLGAGATDHEVSHQVPGMCPDGNSLEPRGEGEKALAKRIAGMF